LLLAIVLVKLAGCCGKRYFSAQNLPSGNWKLVYIYRRAVDMTKIAEIRRHGASLL